MAARKPDFPPSAAERAQIVRIGVAGDGIAVRPDGTRFYVPHTLPGEVVAFRPVARRGDGWTAAVEAIIEPSPARTAPACPHFGSCGGCALQHWQQDAYLAWKSSLLATALRRAGFAGTVAEIAETPGAARRRMDFAARRDGAALRLGLHVAHGRDIADLRTCSVLHPALVSLFDPLRDLLVELAALRRHGAVQANLLDTGPDLLVRTDGGLSVADRARLADFARAHALPRIAWARGEDDPEIAVQLRPTTITFGGVAVSPPPGAFLQASREGEAAIVAAVLAGLSDIPPSRARIVELYAGCGTLTFPLAARARVVAVEGNAAAAAALATAARRAALAGRVTVHQRDLARQPLTATELADFSVAVLNPPQAGAASQMALLAASKIARVIYVSCNPASLARDAATLRAAGYRLLAAYPIDQFRWSARVESVSVFAR